MTAERKRAPETPLISALICTFNRAPLLRRALAALCAQTLAPDHFEVVIVDDGSTDDTREVVNSFQSMLPIHYAFQANSGLAAAKNHGISLSKAPFVLFMDDDDVADDHLLEQHCITHKNYPESNYAVLGYTDLAPMVANSPLMHFVTKIGHHLFSYSNLDHSDILDFSFFWGGRSSCKKVFLMENGVFNPIFRFGAEDIELGFRLSRFGLKVVYNQHAVSHMIRTLDFDDFCGRCYQQGRSNWKFSKLHPDEAVQQWTMAKTATDEWVSIKPHYNQILKSGRDLDRFAIERVNADLPIDAVTTVLLHHAYHQAFNAERAKGMVKSMMEMESQSPSNC